MKDTNKNLTNCDFCNHCNSCDYCNSCTYCDFCNHCDSCDYCNSCDYCSFCDSCDCCHSCTYCDFCHSCTYCKFLSMSEQMLFCLGDGNYESKGEGFQKNNRIFNVDVKEGEVQKARQSLPEITLNLKDNSYEEAWAIVWENLSKADRQKFLDLPHFNKDIFKEITGIDVSANPVEMEIGGAKYRLVEEE